MDVMDVSTVESALGDLSRCVLAFGFPVCVLDACSKNKETNDREEWRYNQHPRRDKFTLVESQRRYPKGCAQSRGCVCDLDRCCPTVTQGKGESQVHHLANTQKHVFHDGESVVRIPQLREEQL